MAKLWQVQIKATSKFPNARVSGHQFYRSNPVHLKQNQMNDEIKNSPVLDVEEIDDPDRPTGA